MSQSQCLWDCLDVMSVAKCVSLMSHIKLRCFVSCSAGTDPGPFAMAKKQQNLKDLWLSATPGRLSPWQQAKALALREVNMELHGGKVHRSWICARLTRGGGGPVLQQSVGGQGGGGKGVSNVAAGSGRPAGSRRLPGGRRVTGG